jgi:hypothetical protein
MCAHVSTAITVLTFPAGQFLMDCLCVLCGVERKPCVAVAQNALGRGWVTQIFSVGPVVRPFKRLRGEIAFPSHIGNLEISCRMKALLLFFMDGAVFGIAHNGAFALLSVPGLRSTSFLCNLLFGLFLCSLLLFLLLGWLLLGLFLRSLLLLGFLLCCHVYPSFLRDFMDYKAQNRFCQAFSGFSNALCYCIRKT